MKNITLIWGLVLVLIMISCDTQKSLPSNYPCQDCKSTSSVFSYMSQYVASNDKQIQQARTVAANTARAELAVQINATFKRVVDDYTNEYIAGMAVDSNQRMQDVASAIVNQMSRDAFVICEGTMPTNIAGNTICFACVELTVKSVLESVVNKISEDEKIGNYFEEEKFKKIFNEEMSKMKR